MALSFLFIRLDLIFQGILLHCSVFVILGIQTRNFTLNYTHNIFKNFFWDRVSLGYPSWAQTFAVVPCRSPRMLELQECMNTTCLYCILLKYWFVVDWKYSRLVLIKSPENESRGQQSLFTKLGRHVRGLIHFCFCVRFVKDANANPVLAHQVFLKGQNLLL